ncbi:PREDICTED: probable ATP-dependent RNA helicase CG8611 isoform X3 [Rhagoletis zephyria]|uniref:probable ATP-dependent RNA helicase CG8611 isoform X3 n=1 Tax=Rhagoletis zephyria TaxID=28612 RepID=UPI0008115503|nr:PREDICTED: probable ATP-dependent RNA helicase CG8611 isoform X3 [Rhagoletis zephyria]
MDIALNIATVPSPTRSVPTPVKKKTFSRGTASSNEGFTFSFGGAQHKVKAIVARKRPAKRPQSSNVSKQTPSVKLGVQKIVQNGDNMVSSSISQKREQQNSFKSKPPNIDDGLILNITTDSGPIIRRKPKPKLSQAERLRNKAMQTKERNSNEFSKIKGKNANKFSDRRRHPNDKNEENEKSGENDQQNGVNLIARKANAFRVVRLCDKSVKKVGLFSNSPDTPVMGQRFVKPITERLFDGTKVDTLKIHPHAVKNLADILSIVELTTVQKKTIPLALEGKDLLIRSQTGSGKTLAYALPVVEKLQDVRPKITRDAGVLAVIIVPTRELAMQTYELFQKLVKPFTWIVPGVLMGGERRKAEKARIRKGINILVGTPGRVLDHLLHTETFKVHKTQCLVLDEADRLLEMGYELDVKQIVELIDTQRSKSVEENKDTVPHLQRLLLSATLTANVQRLAGLTLKEPIFVDNSDEAVTNTKPKTKGYIKSDIAAQNSDMQDDGEDTSIMTIPENLKLNFVVVPPKLRLVTLCGILTNEFNRKQRLKAIVFMSTMEMVNYHHDLLNELLTEKVLDDEDKEVVRDEDDSESDQETALLKGLRFFRLHGSMSQTERQGVFNGFRECKSGVLLTTDVAGRGVDVPKVELVVQYSPPQNIADFVHRVGRTARAGQSGQALLLLTPSEAQLVRFLEDHRIRISQVDMEIYLKTLNEKDDDATTVQEAASNLQHKIQELIADDKELHKNACKAFVSWTKSYSTFPKELKPIFNIKNAHMGHFAKSFGLKDQPKTFTKKHTEPKPPPPTNRLTYTERDPEKIKTEKRAKKRRFTTTVTNEVRDSNRPQSNKLVKMLPVSRALTTSEFDSGLPAQKKRKKA